METRYSRVSVSSITSVNYMIDKYGHDCTVQVATNPIVQSKALFTRNKVSLAGGSLILNANYKLLVKVVSYPVEITPTTTKITINGLELTTVSAKKITPDGANAWIWEIEAVGDDIIPTDVNSLSTPTVVSPANNTENYTSVEGEGGWSITVEGSVPVPIGSGVFVSSDWQIATDSAFTALVVDVVAHENRIYTTGALLQRSTKYYIRTRYNSNAGTTTDWSDVNLFSLDSLVEQQHINKPSLINFVNSETPKLSSSDVYLNGATCFVDLQADAYSPIDAGAFASITFQIASDAAFTTIVQAKTQSDGYGYDYENQGYYEVTNMYPRGDYALTVGNTYYGRVRYTSVDPYDSEWSDTLMFVAG